MAAEFRKASRFFNKFLKATLGNYMRLLFGYEIFNDTTAGLKPPYIVLANHTNFWDPFLLSMCFPEPVHFVTSDLHFRHPLLRQLLKLVGAIPKTKNVSDPQTIKDIIRVTRNGGIIGIFPEGRRSWDGRTLSLFYPTAKLIKSLKLPVVTVLFKGAYLSMPRWAKKTRKGQLHMICGKLLNTADLAVLSSDEIYAKIIESLSYDEYEYQKEKMIRYKSGAPAEKLELLLFCCPACKSMGTLKSKKEDFFCSNCGHAVKYNEYGFFDSVCGELFYENPRDWNHWQLKYLESLLDGSEFIDPSTPIFEDNNVLLHSGTGKRHKALKKEQTGKLAVFQDHIRFEGQNSLTLEFPLHSISGENVQMNNQLEFYYDKTLYKFTGDSYSLSAYKWVKAIELYKKIKKC
jgi:1-acyl-sn-glycerol-3-phosphate acyltransferase